MNVLQIIPFLAPEFGGSVTIAYNLSLQLQKRGHRVTILTTDYKFDAEYAHEAEKLGVEVASFPCSINLGSLHVSPSMRKWLYMHTAQCDVLHLHNLRSYQNIAALSCATNAAKPFVLQPHGTVPRIMDRRILKSAYDLVWGRRLMKKADFLIAVSKMELRQFEDWGAESGRTVVVPNALDTERLRPCDDAKRTQVRNSLGVDSTSKLILYVGRIHKIKGLDFLVRSFAVLSKKRTGVKLVIAGPDDGYREHLEGLVRNLGIDDRVIFVGFTRNVNELYGAADLLVCPAIYEIFGLVPFESLVCGTPVVVTDGCGCGDLVREANCGYIVEYGNIAELNDTIEIALDDNQETKEMIARGQDYVLRNLNWEEATKRIESVYENCIHHV